MVDLIQATHVHGMLPETPNRLEKLHTNQEEEKKVAVERLQKHQVLIFFYFFNSLSMKMLYLAQPTSFKIKTLSEIISDAIFDCSFKVWGF